MRSRLAVVLSLTAVLAAALTGCGTVASATNASGSAATATVNANSADVAMPLPGHTAPAFHLASMSGGRDVSLAQLLAKGPVLLNVWASWCHPCNVEAPALVKEARLDAGKVQFVGVDATSLDSAGDAKSFVKKYSISYPVLMDTQGYFFQLYGISALPTSYLITATGTIVAMKIGQFTSVTELQAFLAPVLK